MKWLRVGLEIVGAASLLVGMALVAWIVYGNASDKVNKATRKDAQFILNGSGLSTNQDYKIISSYESSRSLTGDHLDYYCIELPKFEVAEWAKEEWQNLPEQNPILAAALQLAVNDAR